MKAIDVIPKKAGSLRVDEVDEPSVGRGGRGDLVGPFPTPCAQSSAQY
jgi:hypothetical protein